MGLFDKIKNVLFEEEEIEEETPQVEDEINNKEEVVFKKVEEVKEYRPLPDHNKVEPVRPKEPAFEKVEVESTDFSERELFKSDSTFKFPAFDEEEFNTSMPHEEDDQTNNNVLDFEKRKREERRQDYSRFDNKETRNVSKEEFREEKKRFKPSPVISPVYGILDKDYKAEDIQEAPKNQNNNIISAKDYVDSVRAKAFGKLDDITENIQDKPVIKSESYEIKKDTIEEIKEEIPEEVEEEVTINNQPEANEESLEDMIDDVIISDEPIIEDSSKLMEERTKTIDELLKDASDDIIEVGNIVDDTMDDIEEDINIDDDYQNLGSDIDEVVESKKDVFEDTKDKFSDTLENDLYDLIDSMYDNTEEGE